MLSNGLRDTKGDVGANPLAAPGGARRDESFAGFLVSLLILSCFNGCVKGRLRRDLDSRLKSVGGVVVEVTSARRLESSPDEIEV